MTKHPQPPEVSTLPPMDPAAERRLGDALVELAESAARNDAARAEQERAS